MQSPTSFRWPSLSFGLLFACAAFAPDAKAESLRCEVGIAAEGDSRLAVLYKCGEPKLRDSFCAPVYAPGSLYPVPAPWAQVIAPCMLTEEWIYERGPGNLVATVRFASGKVQSIRYGRVPR